MKNKNEVKKMNEAIEAKDERAFRNLMTKNDTINRLYLSGKVDAKKLHEVREELASAIVSSALKKLGSMKSKKVAEDGTILSLTFSDSEAIRRLQKGKSHDIKLSKNTLRAVSESVTVRIDKNGKEHRKEEDVPMMHETFSDSMDLLQSAYETIMVEAQKMVARGQRKSFGFEIPYFERVLDKRVLIRTEDSAKWKTVTVLPIQKVYRAVRDGIGKNRQVSFDSGTRFVYLSHLVRENEDGEEEVIYKRFPSYWLDYETIEEPKGKHGKKSTVIRASISDETADEVQKMELLVSKLGLTELQKNTLELRLKGYKDKAIASYFGVSFQTIQERMKAIQKKAEAVGLHM